jgi:hypothetical protein
MEAGPETSTQVTQRHSDTTGDPGGLSSGTRVRLRPAQRSDSLDRFLDGRAATVVGVHTTLEGQRYVSVTVDDDPGATTDPRYRRMLFFHPEEVVPLERPAPGTSVDQFPGSR